MHTARLAVLALGLGCGVFGPSSGMAQRAPSADSMAPGFPPFSDRQAATAEYEREQREAAAEAAEAREAEEAAREAELEARKARKEAEAARRAAEDAATRAAH